MSDRSAPVLTFLFTDIEGSTRLWEESPEAMQDIVAHHDEFLAQAVTQHQGDVVKQTGDGIFAVFSDPMSAIETAIDAQKEFNSDDQFGVLPVRIGIHSGTAVPRGDDYFGNEVNRAARLMGVANGGQILISGVTSQLVGGSPPQETSLKDLGVHRLRDLSEPMTVFQLMSPHLPNDFPPIHSLDGFPNNLPADLSSFVGRATDISSVTEQLHANRLISLTGAGGSGKTRLSLQVAAELLPEFADGAWFVDLAGLIEPDLVPLEIATTLHVPERVGRQWLEVLSEFAMNRKLLLILDNCEHLLQSAATVVSTLLQVSPGLKVLTTTREPLNVPGEVAWRVPTLQLPGAEDLEGLDELLAYEAPQLFVERALAAKPDLDLSDDDVPAITEVCRRLDGLPLALELAAARVRALSIGEIASHLGDRFALLSRGSRTAMPRHRTLEGAVAWSYEMLDDNDRGLFCNVSIFNGGFDLSAAQAVGGSDALNGVTSLVEKSLLSTKTSPHGTRYRMLETVAAFAHQKLGQEFAAARDAHLQWATSLAGTAAAELDGPRQPEWLERIATELDNMRAAMQWALDGGDPALGTLIAGSLYRYWFIRGVREGHHWLDLLLEADPELTTEARGRVLFAYGSLTQSQGQHSEATAILEESARIFDEIGERRGGAYARHYLIRSVWGSVDADELRNMIDSDLAEFRAVNDPVGVVLTLFFDALWHAEYGNPADVETTDEMRKTAEAIGAPQLVAHADEIPAVTYWLSGDVDSATPLLAHAAEIYLDLQNAQCAAHFLENTAGWAQRVGRSKDAALLLGSSTALRTEVGIPTPRYETLLYDVIEQEVKGSLGDEFSTLFDRGKELSMDEALEQVMTITSASS